MDFGLGLVLSFTDNATAGINSAVNSLNQLTQVAENAGNSLNEFASLSAFSSIATSVGNSMTSMGTNIISTFGQIIGKVNQTGQTLMYAENQLSKLYEGSGKTGKDVLADITQYAKTSIFEFEDLIPVVTMLKANGIEAFDMIASSTGNANQTLMDYAADLAAFNPQMKNAYGTGIKAAMGALNEYIAEGNAMSLKRGASLDITGLLGEEKGATIEERSRQVADLMEKLNMVGMTAQLAQSPMTKLSNMSDTLFQFIGMISQSGVYDAFNEIIDVFSSFVMSIDDSTLQNVASIVGDALSALLKPVQQLAQWIVKLADGFIKLVESNPALAKFATIATAIAGVLLVVGGVALKFAGSIGYLTLMLKSLSTSFGAIGTVMKSGATKIVGALIPVTLALGVMYLVWKNDLFGIRTLVTGFVQNVVNSFKTAKTAVSGSLADMQATLKTFDTQNNFFDGLTLSIMRVMVLFQALAEGWNDYTLSEETFAKAKELGILPLIEAIFNLKYRFDLFKEGFIQGWLEISNKVKEFLFGLADSLDGTMFDGLLDGVTKFIQKLSENDPEAWKDFGRIVGELSAKFLLAFVAVKTFMSVAGKIATLIGVVTKLGGVFGKVFGFMKGLFVPIVRGILEVKTLLSGGMIAPVTKIGQLFVKLGGIVSKLGGAFTALKTTIVTAITGLASAIGAPVAAVVAVIVAILATVITYAVTHWEEFKAKMISIWTTVKDEALAIWESLKSGLQRIWENLKSAVSPVVEAFNSLKGKFVELFEQLKQNEQVQAFIGILSAIGETIINILVPAIKTIVRVVSSALQGIWNIVVTVFNSIVNIISSILTNVMNIIGGILDIIIGIFTGDLDRIWQGVSTIFTSILNVITTILTSVWNVIQSILSTIANVFSSILTGIVNIVSGAFQGIVSIVGSLLDAVFSKVSSVWNNIKSTVDSVVSGMSTSVQNKWNAIKNAITNAIEGARDAVKNAINKIKSFFDFDWSLPKLKLPHLTITGGFSIAPPSVPKFSVDWYEKGGVFNKPSVIGVGENGQEAVMPLENNTEWIGILANMIAGELRSIRPTNTSETNNTTNNGDTTNRYLTTNNTSNETVQGDTDNSINFHEGAIQVTVQNASEEEAMRLAKMIMEYIKRQKQLDRMMNYA